MKHCKKQIKDNRKLMTELNISGKKINEMTDQWFLWIASEQKKSSVAVCDVSKRLFLYSMLLDGQSFTAIALA